MFSEYLLESPWLLRYSSKDNDEADAIMCDNIVYRQFTEELDERLNCVLDRNHDQEVGLKLTEPNVRSGSQALSILDT